MKMTDYIAKTVDFIKTFKTPIMVFVAIALIAIIWGVPFLFRG